MALIEDEDCDMIESCGPTRPIKRSITEKLNDRKARLENELKEINQTLDLLEQNPKVQCVLNSLSKLNLHL